MENEGFMKSTSMDRHAEAMARAKESIHRTMGRVPDYQPPSKAEKEEEAPAADAPYIEEITDDEAADLTKPKVQEKEEEEKGEEASGAPAGNGKASGPAGVKQDGEADEEEEEEEEEEELSEEELQERVAKATELKAKGNAAYAGSLWEEADQYYTQAIGDCGLPRKHQLRAACHCNRAAARAQMEGMAEEVVRDCDAALAIQPDYLKARVRKAKALEELEKLKEALDEYKAALEINKNVADAKAAVARLPKEIEEKQKKETEEMMGKLKDVGNSLLGLVGMSLDQFQFVQDPKTGGYSVNMTNGK